MKRVGADNFVELCMLHRQYTHSQQRLKIAASAIKLESKCLISSFFEGVLYCNMANTVNFGTHEIYRAYRWHTRLNPPPQMTCHKLTGVILVVTLQSFSYQAVIRPFIQGPLI